MPPGAIDSLEIIDLEISYDYNYYVKTPEALVEVYNKESQQNPEELGAYFEGDILIPLRYRNGILELSYRWPGGVVPYEIQGPFTDQELRQINHAIQVRI